MVDCTPLVIAGTLVIRGLHREQLFIHHRQQLVLLVARCRKADGITMQDAEWFYHKGRGNGWTNGGKPILDWKATLRSWKRAGYLPSQKNAKHQSKPTAVDYKRNYLPPPREPTDQEFEEARRVAKEAGEKFRQEFNK